MQWSSDRNQISGLAMALFVIFAGAGFVLDSVTGSRALLIAGLLVGTYLLFSIKVADQWEKVAVLRLGRYIGLRGPGWFHVVPIIDMLSRRVDQRVRTANVTAESHADARHCAGECGRDCFLDGVERGEVDSGSAGLCAGDHDERADGAAGIDRPARAGADDYGARIDGT